MSKIKFLYLLYTLPSYLLLFLYSVRFGKKVLFCGFPSVKRMATSVIEIGNYCRFMSFQTGNRIGLNHKCMLSTQPGAVLKIGNNCAFSGVSIRCFKSITLGNNVRVGANVLILDGDGHPDDPRAGKNKPVVIEDYVWLGGNVVVKKGVHIGRNSVIGMNSVVSKDVPANCMAIGNPCIVVRQFDADMINKIEEYYK